MVFKVKGDYSVRDAEGNIKLIKKGVITRIDIPIDDIYAYEEVADKKGRVLKGSCRIFMKNDLRELVVMCPFDRVGKKITKEPEPSRTVITGFKRYDS